MSVSVALASSFIGGDAERSRPARGNVGVNHAPVRPVKGGGRRHPRLGSSFPVCPRPSHGRKGAAVACPRTRRVQLAVEGTAQVTMNAQARKPGAPDGATPGAPSGRPREARTWPRSSWQQPRQCYGSSGHRRRMHWGAPKPGRSRRRWRVRSDQQEALRRDYPGATRGGRNVAPEGRDFMATTPVVSRPGVAGADPCKKARGMDPIGTGAHA